MAYTEIENALVQKLKAVFSAELNDDNCKAGDADGVFNAVFTDGSQYGVILEYEDGRSMSRQPFDKLVWTWVIAGIFIVRYDGNNVTVEQNMRSIVDRLFKLFEHDHTLGGVAPKAQMLNIGRPEPAAVGDMPFYWVPFVVGVIDR